MTHSATNNANPSCSHAVVSAGRAPSHGSTAARPPQKAAVVAQTARANDEPATSSGAKTREYKPSTAIIAPIETFCATAKRRWIGGSAARFLSQSGGIGVKQA